MSKNLLKRLNNTVLGGAMLISVFSVLSKVLGLVRDRMLASSFGAGEVLDSYFAAFRIPDFIFNSLVLGALAAAFIPVFIKLDKQDKNYAIRVSNSILNIITVILSVLCLLAFINVGALVKILAPGFSYYQLALTTRLTSIMLISVVIFGFASVMGSILNSKKTYIAYSIAPVLYNVGLIFGIILSKYFGYDMLAWGVVIGALLHFLIQLISVSKLGWKYEFIFDFRDKNVIKIFKLMIPRTLALILGQINQFVITIIASSLVVGSISIFYFGINLQSFVVSIFGVSIAIAIFPVLSGFVNEGKINEFNDYLNRNLKKITFFVVPISAFMILTRFEIVKIILGAGSFDIKDINYTASVLGWFCVSILFQCMAAILARAFYAFEDTKSPVILSFISLSINVALAIFLSNKIGILGLAIAFSISNTIFFLLLAISLSLKYKVFQVGMFFRYFFKILLNSALVIAIAYLLKLIYIKYIGLESLFRVFAEFLILFIISFVLYYFISVFEKLDEVQFIRAFINKFVKIK